MTSSYIFKLPKKMIVLILSFTELSSEIFLFCSLSYELNPDWSRVFSSQDEILQYLQQVADKYGIRNKIELGKRVTRMVWDEEIQKWSITLSDGEVITYIIVTREEGKEIILGVSNKRNCTLFSEIFAQFLIS